MSVLVTLTVGLIWWICAWAFGIKAFDAFILTTVMVVTAAGLRMAKPFIDHLRGRESAAPTERGAGV